MKIYKKYAIITVFCWSIMRVQVTRAVDMNDIKIPNQQNDDNDSQSEMEEEEDDDDGSPAQIPPKQDLMVTDSSLQRMDNLNESVKGYEIEHLQKKTLELQRQMAEWEDQEGSFTYQQSVIPSKTIVPMFSPVQSPSPYLPLPVPQHDMFINNGSPGNTFPTGKPITNTQPIAQPINPLLLSQGDERDDKDGGKTSDKVINEEEDGDDDEVKRSTHKKKKGKYTKDHTMLYSIVGIGCMGCSLMVIPKKRRYGKKKVTPKVTKTRAVQKSQSVSKPIE